MQKTLSVILAVMFFITACTAQAAVPANLPISTSTSMASSTNTLIPTTTLTLTPYLTATPVPHPMSIIALRAGDYPGSEVTIVKELDKGLNYHRYYAYYLSEELKIYALLTIPNGQPPEGGWPALYSTTGISLQMRIAPPKGTSTMWMKSQRRDMSFSALIIAGMMLPKARRLARMATLVIKSMC